MTIKALFLDFYGTIVHEDDDYIFYDFEEMKKILSAAMLGK